MRTFGNKHYFSRAETRAMSIDHPIGDPTGGPAYGERNDPVSGVVIGGGASLLGGYMGGKSQEGAAETSAAAQRYAADRAAESARFTPVGTTTRFGQSAFEYDPSGRLSGAGYNLSPEMQAQQDYFMAMADQGLDQYGMGQAYAQPMLGASQDMMALGQQYLGTSPQDQAAKYMQNQQALLAPSRAAQLSGVRQDLFNTGRTGLAVGGDMGTLATNPEMAAYYNSIAQQDAQLAAQAEQNGMEYAKFGAGMMGSGGNMLGSYYGAQTQALQPYQTAFGAAQGIEGLGQGAMDIGSSLGAQQSTAGANQGQAIMKGYGGAAQTQQAGAFDPWSTMLQSTGNMMSNYRWPQSGVQTDYSMPMQSQEWGLGQGPIG